MATAAMAASAAVGVGTGASVESPWRVHLKGTEYPREDAVATFGISHRFVSLGHCAQQRECGAVLIAVVFVQWHGWIVLNRVGR